MMEVIRTFLDNATNHGDGAEIDNLAFVMMLWTGYSCVSAGHAPGPMDSLRLQLQQG